MYRSLLLLIGVGLAAAIIVGLARRSLRARRRARLRTAPLPPEQVAILERRMPLYRRMPDALREQLHGLINVFLDEKRFTGCGGLEVTEEMRVTIAGNACLLLLNREPGAFPGFTSILVYPDSFVAPTVDYDGEIEITGYEARAGEAHRGGPVVLSWGDVMDGIGADDDGANVVLHEFAHKLDEQDGDFDGLPVLRDAAHYAEWAEVLTREFAAHQARVDAHSHDILDDYGATAPEEFFAVATEAFFERGAEMRAKLPALYGQLERFYGVDPAAWR